MSENEKGRKRLVYAMETIIRHLNNENDIDTWLAVGVADGDIDLNNDIENVPDYYIEDNTISELMGTFIKIMNRTDKKAGMWIGSAISR